MIHGARRYVSWGEIKRCEHSHDRKSPRSKSNEQKDKAKRKVEKREKIWSASSLKKDLEEL